MGFWNLRKTVKTRSKLKCGVPISINLERNKSLLWNWLIFTGELSTWTEKGFLFVAVSIVCYEKVKKMADNELDRFHGETKLTLISMYHFHCLSWIEKYFLNCQERKVSLLGSKKIFRGEYFPWIWISDPLTREKKDGLISQKLAFRFCSLIVNIQNFWNSFSLSEFLKPIMTF